jgi:hypothetical protein
VTDFEGLLRRLRSEDVLEALAELESLLEEDENT